MELEIIKDEATTLDHIFNLLNTAIVLVNNDGNSEAVAQLLEDTVRAIDEFYGTKEAA